MDTAIRTNIKSQLAKKNISAAELERRTGIPHAVVNILHGRSKNPSLRTAQAIARELDCSVEELFTEQTENTTNQDGWDANLFKKATETVCKEIANSKLRPQPHEVAECVSEVYVYAKGSPSQNVDQRFVSWIITKKFSSSNTNN